MAKSKKRYPKTFRPPLILKLGVLIPFFIASLFFISFLAVFFGGMLMGYNIPIGLAIFVGLFIYYFLFSVMWSCIEYIFHFAVVVTPKGIWFHGYGKRFYTWDSMIKLGKQKKWSSELDFIHFKQHDIKYLRDRVKQGRE